MMYFYPLINRGIVRSDGVLRRRLLHRRRHLHPGLVRHPPHPVRPATKGVDPGQEVEADDSPHRGHRGHRGHPARQRHLPVADQARVLRVIEHAVDVERGLRGGEDGGHAEADCCIARLATQNKFAQYYRVAFQAKRQSRHALYLNEQGFNNCYTTASRVQLPSETFNNWNILYQHEITYVHTYVFGCITLLVKRDKIICYYLTRFSVFDAEKDYAAVILTTRL